MTHKQILNKKNWKIDSMMKTCLQKKTIATSLQKACEYYMKMWQLIKSTCKHTILFIASANKGGLCLVAKHVFPFRQKLLHNIRSYVSSNVLSHGNRNTVKDA